MMTNPSIPSNPSRNPKIKINSFHHYQAALDSLSLQNLPFPITPSSFPPCKHIPNTHFLVDSFRFPTASSTAHFLSHFHSDHYSGLSPCWSHGIVFCSSVTASLLTCILKVRNEFVFALPLYEIVRIDGCEVVLVDANHCPGAVQFLFRIPSKDFDSRFEIYVHTGDFRFCEEMKADPFLNSCIGCDAVFLDTTYCNKKFVFPLQEESVDYVVDVIERIGGEFNGLEKRVLFLVATYVIGKEKILVEVSQRCKRKVCVDRRKMEVLRVLGYGDGGVFTEDENESDVHVVGWNVLGETWPYFRPNFGNMKKIMDDKGYSRVVGFVPTGWTYEVKRNKFAVRTKDSFEIHLVPYSEHSNYDELREYVKFLRPKKVIPTVGVDIEKIDSKEAQKMKKHFAGLVDETANKEFLMGFHRASSKKVVNEGVEATLDIDEGVDGEGKEAKLSGMEALEDNDKGDGLNTFTLEELKSENVVAATPSEMHALEDNDIGVELNPFTLKETNSEDVVVASNEVMEKMIEELHQCLPSWVTRDQILTLIDNSKRNIVDAVSNFYECETEFYEQVADSLPSVSASQCGSIDDNDSISELVVSKSNHERTDSPLSKLFKLPVAKSAIKSGVSPGKRKRNVNSKPGKRGKTNTKSVTVGPKQSTITSFFNKRLPSAAKVEGVSEQCTVNENPRPKDDTISYTEEVDQFLRIIDGYESSRTYAVTLLERTKGDLNKALDLHYGNPESDRGENDGNLVVSVDANWNSVYLKSNVAEVAEPIGDTSVQTQSREAVDATLISLPPEKYKPLEHACWDVGQPAPYIHLARTFELVEAEKGKIKATSMICNMFRSLLALSPEDILPAVYLCTNKLGADHENLELNIGGSLVTSALEEACGTNRARLRELYNSLGDLGDVAQVCRQTQRLLAPPPPLLIRDVFSVLRKISVQTGSGSSAKKKSFIMRLVRSCREKEMKFIVRTLVRNLRIGAMMRTILPALAQAVVMNSFDKSGNNGKIENLKEKLQCISAAVVEAYNILPALDLIVPSLISKGVEFSASSLSMVPGIPIKPMLAKIANGASQALKVYQNKAFTCEYKYDGQRAQIHKLADGTIRIFSRNGDETTSRFPDLVQLIEEYCKPSVTTFIVDAEVVAVDRKNGCKLMSFQELSSRERGKRDSLTTVTNIKVEICVFVFDVMFANGKQLLVCPLRQRRQRLKELFNDERSGYFEYAKNMMVEADEACTSNETTTRMNAFLEEALQSSCEGIMVKSLDVDSSYSPSKRTDTWLKVKRDYVDGLNDSLDLVPIGAWHGNGRKAGWYSPFLVACYNPEGEEYQSVCRVMSGFSDAFYIEMKEFFSGDRILSKKPPYYRTAEVPDMWFSPELVWEIRGADFTVSPVHQAAVGLVHPARGISMRFPRFVSSITDRNPEDCSTAEDIAEMFNSQTRKMDVNAGT